MIDLTIDHNHKKFILEIKHFNLKEYSDFYYYVIDDGIEEKINILIENQIENLKSWKERILNFSSGDIFLPFDFSNQYLGCFKLIGNSQKVLITYGYFDNIRGAYPSYCRPLKRIEEYGNFIEDFPAVEINCEEFILDIERIISNHSKELSSI